MRSFWQLFPKALSENFYKDKTLTDALLAAVGKGGDKVLPLQLDKAAIPDDIKNAIYARNIIPVGGRDADLVADRIIDALPAKKSRLPVAFIAGGAALQRALFSRFCLLLCKILGARAADRHEENLPGRGNAPFFQLAFQPGQVMAQVA